MIDLSIIVPVYNVENYISRLVDSIHAHNSVNLTMECIFVNDCTTDGSIDILIKKMEEYGDDKISYTLLNHSKNLGLSAARNTGFNSAKGKYVLFVDSDDRLTPNALECFWNIIIQNRDINFDFVLCNSYDCKNKKPMMSFDFDSPIMMDNRNEYALKLMLKQKLVHTAWNKLVRRSFLVDNGICFDDGIIHEDILWSYKLFLYACKIVVVPEITYIYEDNPTSIINTSINKIELTIGSGIFTCGELLLLPPKNVFPEYLLFIFYVYSRTKDLYRLHEKNISLLRSDVFAVKKRICKYAWKNRCFPLLMLFLTMYKPFSYIILLKWYRRYFNKILNAFLKI